MASRIRLPFTCLIALACAVVSSPSATAAPSRAGAARSVDPRETSSTIPDRPPPVEEATLDGVGLFGAELTRVDRTVLIEMKGGPSRELNLSGLQIGRMDPEGASARAKLYSGDVIEAAFELDQDAKHWRFTNGPLKSEEAFSAHLARFGGGTRVLLRVRNANNRHTQDYEVSREVIVSLQGRSDPQSYVESVRPRAAYGRSGMVIQTYRTWYDEFKVTPQGRELVARFLPQPTPRGSFTGKKFSQYLVHNRPPGNRVSLYYDHVRAMTEQPLEIDAYVKVDQVRDLAKLQPPSPDIARRIKMAMLELCPSATSINIYTVSADEVMHRYQILAEGGSVGSWTTVDNEAIDSTRKSVTEYGFDRKRYQFGRTIQDIIDDRHDLIRSNEMILRNLDCMAAHYAVAFGASVCATDTVEYSFTKVTTHTQTSGWFSNTWSDTHNDRIKLATRHKGLVDYAFGVRDDQFNAFNTAMWKDMIEFFRNYPCDHPVHAVFEENLWKLVDIRLGPKK